MDRVARPYETTDWPGQIRFMALGSLIQDAIGKKVETESGETGLLICSNGMGIQPLDLFNDIMTTQRDLQNFLGEENYKPTDGNIALSIKAYLKFCALTKDWFNQILSRLRSECLFIVKPIESMCLGVQINLQEYS